MEVTRLHNYLLNFRKKLVLLLVYFLPAFSNLYGIEYYETGNPNFFDYSLIEGRTFYQYNVPCSVCMSQGRSNQVTSICQLKFLNFSVSKRKSNFTVRRVV